MKTNMGSLDRILRIILAVAFAALILTGVAVRDLGHQSWAFWRASSCVTSIVGFCPLYALLGVSTKKRPPQA